MRLRKVVERAIIQLMETQQTSEANKMLVIELNQQAYHAIRAASLWNQCGKDAMTRYAEKQGVHPSLVRLARQLEAVTKAGL